MLEFVVDGSPMQVGCNVAAVEDVVVEAQDDEEDGFIEVKLTHEGLIVDVWQKAAKESVATMSMTYQELAEHMLQEWAQ